MEESRAEDLPAGY